MKQIIDGLIYDTKTATKLISVETGSNFSWNGYHFYLTPNNRLFKEHVYFRCMVDGSTNRLSMSSESEMIEILIKYDTDIKIIKALCPNFKLEIA